MVKNVKHIQLELYKNLTLITILIRKIHSDQNNLSQIKVNILINKTILSNYT